MIEVSAPAAAAQSPADRDARLLAELLDLLPRLERERARFEGMKRGQGGVPVLVALAAIVNAMVAFISQRTSDVKVLPSRVLAQLADAQPYTQLLGEEQERITVATAAAVLDSWNGEAADRQRMLQDLCAALLDVLVMYSEVLGSLLAAAPARDQWREVAGVFVNELREAVQRIVT